MKFYSQKCGTLHIEANELADMEGEVNMDDESDVEIANLTAQVSADNDSTEQTASVSNFRLFFVLFNNLLCVNCIVFT